MALDQSALEKPFQRVRKRLKKWTNPPDPDDVHGLRTNSRRIEMALKALRFDSARTEQRLLDSLARLRRRAGRVRDMDVLTTDVLTLQLSGEQECALRLVEHLSTERHRQARKIGRLVRKLRTPLRRDLKRVGSKLADAAGNHASGRQKDRKPAVHVAALALQLAGQLNDPRRLTHVNLHPYRLKLKQLRYVLELTAAEERDETFINALKKAQDTIGEWHDWESLSVIGADVVDHEGCRLLQQIKTNTQQSYNRALSMSYSLRRRYAEVDSSARRTTSSRAPGTLRKLPAPTLAASITPAA